MDQPDYDERPGIQRGPAAVFVFEAALALGVSFFAAWQFWSFAYEYMFRSDISAFNEWVLKTVENKTAAIYSAAFILLISLLVISISCLVKSASGFWTVRALEAPKAYNDFALSFIANLNGMIAMLGPDEEVAAGLETGRPAFSGWRIAAIFAYFSVVLCGILLLASSLIYHEAGYHFSERAAFALLFAFPFFPMMFAVIYKPMKAYSASLFIFVIFIVFWLFAVRADLIFYYREFSIATLSYLLLHAIVFVFFISRKSVMGCLLLTNKGLRVLDFRGGSPADISGLFVPSAITAGPEGDFESWTFQPDDGSAPLKIITSGAKLDEFTQLLNSAAGITPAVERSAGRRSISHNFRSGFLKVCMPVLCLAAGVIFSSETFTAWAYLSQINDFSYNEAYDLQLAKGGETEKALRAVLAVYPDEPRAALGLFQRLDRREKSAEMNELLERAGDYQAKRLIPVKNAVTYFIERNKKLIKAALELKNNKASGWEPVGPGLAKFRQGMARAVNFKYDDKGIFGMYGPATEDFFDAMKESPEAAGPRMMLAWQFYAIPKLMIAKMGESASAPKEIFVPFEKYETEILTKKVTLDHRETSVFLSVLRRANEKIAAAALLENDKNFKGFGRQLENALPGFARDKIAAAYLSARFDKKSLSDWDAVLEETAKFRFLDRAPIVYEYDINNPSKLGGMHKLLLDPPENTAEFMKAFPELSGCLGPGEIFTGVKWASLPGMKDSAVAALFKLKYEIMGAVPEKQRDIIRKLK